MLEASDALLLDAWRAGNDVAGRRLFERHVGVVSRFFTNKLDEDVDDLVQLTFMGALQAAERYEGRCSFRGFVLGIAHKLLLKQLRRRYARGRTVDFDQVTLRDLGTSASRRVARDLERERLLETLASLPLTEQVALELYYWEEMPASEVAEVLGVPEGTVRTRIRSARIKLRRKLDSRQAGARPQNRPESDRPA